MGGQLTCAPKPAASPCLSCQNRSKLGQPAHDCLAFLDVPLATGPPNRGVLRTSCIGRAQPMQRGGRGGLGADLSAHLSHMIHVQLANRLSAKSEAAPYMRRQHYRDVAGDLIFGNRRSGASAPVVGFS